MLDSISIVSTETYGERGCNNLGLVHRFLFNFECEGGAQMCSQKIMYINKAGKISTKIPECVSGVSLISLNTFPGFGCLNFF